MTFDELIKCRSADILTCQPEHLADLKQIQLSSSLPVPQRMEQYLAQVRNPYLIRVDKVMVKISFGAQQDLTGILSGLMAEH